MELTVAAAAAPALEEGEWWAHELEGCEVFDGERALGTVARLIELPSCEALEVRPPGGGEPLLVPMVSDAVRAVDVAARPHRGRPATSSGSPIERGERGGALMEIDVFTLFPEWFEWFAASVTSRNVLAAGSTLESVDYREHTPLSGGQVDDMPFGGGAGMVLRVDVIDSALRARYGVDPVRAARAAARDRAVPGRAPARRARSSPSSPPSRR